MEMNNAKLGSWAVLILPASILCGMNQAHSETPPPFQTSTPAASSQPHRPVRIIADLSRFHLDQQPVAKPLNQVGAGSRGTPSALTICAPNEGLSSSTHPLFEWKIPDGNSSKVTFTLLNASGDVLYENEVTGGTLQYPPDAPALVPGQTYSWKVSGNGMDKLPDAVGLEVQSKAVHEALQRRIESEGAATDPLAHAQVFLRDRLWYDAVSTLQVGIHEHPERADLKQQLTVMYLEIAPGCAKP